MKIIFALFLLTAVSLLQGTEYSFENEVRKAKTPQVQLDDQVKVSKTPSVRITNEKGLYKRITLDPASRYRLVFYMKGRNIDSGKNARGKQCGARFYVNNGKKWQCFTALPGNKGETGTFDWKKVEGIVDTSVLGPKVTLSLSLFGNGVVYFDKVRLIKIK